MDNNKRADLAEYALSTYVFAKGEDVDDTEANITDLITDLLHLALRWRKAEGLGVRGAHERILAAAAAHIEAEG